MAIPQEVALLENYVSSAVDHRGFPAGKSSTGGWRSAWYIIGVEVAERFAYFGISSNLISYLTGPLGESTATAAANVNVWAGTASLLPILGAFIADAYFGRYHTIVVASLIYVLGLGLLTLSAVLILIDISDENSATTVSSPFSIVNILFFSSLYLIAIAQGGHKPCVQAFGADQFDADDPHEKIARASFFNWWFLSLSAGITLSILVVVYVQDYVNWALGFGIPCVFMLIALVLFLLGSRTYRYSRIPRDRNAFTRISRVLFIAFKNRDHCSSQPSSTEEYADQGFNPNEEDESRSCNVQDLEEAMALVKLIPIWITTIVSAIPYAQYATFFTKQGLTVDRNIIGEIEIPPASLQMLIGISIVIFVPLYDRIFVPIARSITKEPSGITMLQRVGAGMVLSILTMIVSALVEMERLKIVKEHGLIDEPKVTIPMSIWWFVPQYLLVGFGNVLTLVGTQEFFYDQVPQEFRSIGLALCLSALGIGSFLSSILIYIIDSSEDSWLNNNLNRAHLDYFYFLLALITAVGFSAFLFFSKSYVYRQ